MYRCFATFKAAVRFASFVATEEKSSWPDDGKHLTCFSRGHHHNLEGWRLNKKRSVVPRFELRTFYKTLLFFAFAQPPAYILYLYKKAAILWPFRPASAQRRKPLKTSAHSCGIPSPFGRVRVRSSAGGCRRNQTASVRNARTSGSCSRSGRGKRGG